MFLIAGVIVYDRLVIDCKLQRGPSPLISSDILENAPDYKPPAYPGLTVCDISETLCRAAAYDPYILSVTLWATLQLTWTSLLAVSHLWQVSRQMTTLEVSNLGRYGYMGGRGGQSLRDQSGAMRQAMTVGAGVGPMGASEDAMAENGAAGPEGNVLAGPGHSHKAGGHGHGHSHGIGRFCGALWKGISGQLMQILGLDRFTKGKALGGMKRAGRDQNPFDMGLVQVSADLSHMFGPSAE